MDRTQIPDFRTFFREYLSLNYPDKASDHAFIEIRNQAAVDAFRRARQEGRSVDSSYETALASLLKGYEFSKYDFIEDVLYTRFVRVLSGCNVAELCHALMPVCEQVFARYTLRDEMMYTEDNRALKEEIIRAIEAYLQQPH